MAITRQCGGDFIDETGYEESFGAGSGDAALEGESFKLGEFERRGDLECHSWLSLWFEDKIVERSVSQPRSVRLERVRLVMQTICTLPAAGGLFINAMATCQPRPRTLCCASQRKACADRLYDLCRRDRVFPHIWNSRFFIYIIAGLILG